MIWAGWAVLIWGGNMRVVDRRDQTAAVQRGRLELWRDNAIGIQGAGGAIASDASFARTGTM